MENAVTFRQLDSLQKIAPKPVMVFIHTSWCRYCEAMEQVTFKNKEVNDLLANQFYFISLNAEDEQDMSVKGHIFRFRPTGNGTGQHELALELGRIDGNLSFPTLCILDPEYTIIYQYSGFLTGEQLLPILQLVKSGGKKTTHQAN